jgi:hypothetical protein
VEVCQWKVTLLNNLLTYYHPWSPTVSLGQDIMTWNGKISHVFGNTNICLHQRSFPEHHVGKTEAHMVYWLKTCYSSALATLEANCEWCFYTNTLKTHLGNTTCGGGSLMKWWILQDNVWLHTADTDDRGASRHCGTPANHPLYSPDLASCEVWEFLMLKHELWGQKFSTNTEEK